MKKILIVQARFYKKISDLLLEGAIEEIEKSGYEYKVVDVLGALEIASAISIIDESKEFEGFIALGCVIRGETSHYDIVAEQSARSLSELALNKNIIITNGILTTENEQQAIERADKNQKNKGGFAVRACLNLIEIKKKFSK